MIYFSFVALVINPPHKIVKTLRFAPDYIISCLFCPRNKLHFNISPYRKVTVRQRTDNPPLSTPHASVPPLLSLPLLSPATFICCSINNCYCSFNYAPVISKSGGHVSSPSQGSLGNYRHPSKGQCSRSLAAVAIIMLLLTSVHWTRSPSVLSLSRHAFLCQAWPLTPTPLGSVGSLCLPWETGPSPTPKWWIVSFEYGYFANIAHNNCISYHWYCTFEIIYNIK